MTSSVEIRTLNLISSFAINCIIVVHQWPNLVSSVFENDIRVTRALGNEGLGGFAALYGGMVIIWGRPK